MTRKKGTEGIKPEKVGRNYLPNPEKARPEESTAGMTCRLLSGLALSGEFDYALRLNRLSSLRELDRPDRRRRCLSGSGDSVQLELDLRLRLSRQQPNRTTAADDVHARLAGSAMERGRDVIEELEAACIPSPPGDKAMPGAVNLVAR